METSVISYLTSRVSRDLIVAGHQQITQEWWTGHSGKFEIFASGLRNPWRFSFDRVSSQLYVADVGQGASEEIDIVTLGGNYGWRVFEGTLCTNLGPAACGSNFIPPVAEYFHTAVDAPLPEAMSIADGNKVFRMAPTSMAITAPARSSC